MTTRDWMHRLLEAYAEDFGWSGKTPDLDSTVTLLDNGSPPVYKGCMSSHLSSMIVVGPVKLEPSDVTVAKVVKRARLVISTAQQVLKDPSFDWDHDKLVGEFCHDTDALNDTIALKPVRVLEELLALWKDYSDYLDVNAREARIKGTKFRIFVVGATSYGDEPEGDGYRVFLAAERLGMLPLLGLS